ncbi:amidohydrolase family protein [Sphingomonas sp. MMS24-JH45]
MWSTRLNPSSDHGVTTVVTGNCGVAGFAPCRREDQDLLVDVMSGVEDVPGVVMTEGLAWDLGKPAEFLDAIEARAHDIDIAVLLPHSPLRVYAMGAPGAHQEQATLEDRALMRDLAREAIAAGALGFASSRLALHRTGSGEAIPSYAVAEEEIAAIAEGVADAGGGLMQFVADLPMAGYDAVLTPLFQIARTHGLPAHLHARDGQRRPQLWQTAVGSWKRKYRRRVDHRPDIPGRSAWSWGSNSTRIPSCRAPPIAPWRSCRWRNASRRCATRSGARPTLPTRRSRGIRSAGMSRNWAWLFPLRDRPDYEPPENESIAARAEARGVSPAEEASTAFSTTAVTRRCTAGARRLPRRFARHARATDGSRRRRHRFGRRRSHRHDLRRQFPDVPADAFGARSRSWSGCRCQRRYAT